MKILIDFRNTLRPFNHQFWGELIELDTLNPNFDTCYKIQVKLFSNPAKVQESAGVHYCILLTTLIEIFQKNELYELCHFNNTLLKNYINAIYENKYRL
jgi:hypothetical protein